MSITETVDIFKPLRYEELCLKALEIFISIWVSSEQILYPCHQKKKKKKITSQRKLLCCLLH